MRAIYDVESAKDYLNDGCTVFYLTYDDEIDGYKRIKSDEWIKMDLTNESDGFFIVE